MEPGELVLSDVHINEHYFVIGGKSAGNFPIYFKLCPNSKECLQDDTTFGSETNSTAATRNESVKSAACRCEEFKEGDSEQNTQPCKEKSGVVPIETEIREHDEEEESSCVVGSPITTEESPCVSIASTCGNMKNQHGLCLDEDGDLEVERKTKDMVWTHVVMLEHSLATELQDVGQQVWMGALLLCDFIIHNWLQFKDKVVLDLGAGTGLTSIVASMFSQKVFCTDIGDEVLEQMHRNIQLNSNLSGKNNISIRELDWFRDESYPVPDEVRQLQIEDWELEQTQIILAAEVVYDDVITDAFFRTIYSILSRRPMVLFMALERRYLFTLSKLDVDSPAYEHLVDCLDQLTCLSEDGGVQYTYTRLDTDFSQYFTYTRVKELELFEVKSSFPGS
ncbi:hypothetical protein ScPMuIL_004430 [Solemya velum]